MIWLLLSALIIAIFVIQPGATDLHEVVRQDRKSRAIKNDFQAKCNDLKRLIERSSYSISLHEFVKHYSMQIRDDFSKKIPYSELSQQLSIIHSCLLNKKHKPHV